MKGDGHGEPYDLFIAYAGCDQPLAREFYHHLHERVRTFLDCETLPPESRYKAIPAIQATCCVTAVLVSSRWADQHYAEDELALGIVLSRTTEHILVAVWLDDVPISARPYGLLATAGLHLPTIGSVSAAADELVEVVGRAQKAQKEVGNSASPIASNFEFTDNDKLALHRLQALSEFSTQTELPAEISWTTREKILDRWLEGPTDRK